MSKIFNLSSDSVYQKREKNFRFMILNSLAILKVSVFLIAVFILGEIGYPLQVAAEYSYININDPLVKKIPIAIPEFRPMTGNEEERSIGKESVDILSRALGFTGYLNIMDPLAFLDKPSEKGITGADITYKNWTSIGAELLITGGVVEHDGNIRLELRLFDTFKETMPVAKAYNIKYRNDIRKVIYRFCSDISLALTGKRGVFGSKFTFVSVVDGNKEIFTCDFDGENLEQITFDKNIAISPAWSSDGNYLAYTSYADGNPDIHIRSLKDKKNVAKVNRKGMNITPEWVPDTFALAATLSFSGDQEIYLVLGSGEIKEPPLTRNWGIDVSPSFSPDGKKFAFVSRRSGTPQIFISDMATGSVSRLTFKGNYNTSPAWSPEGDKIAYVGIVKNEIDIYVIDADGGEPLQLTRGRGDNESPTWSPDGGLIAFSSTRQGVSKIYVMSSNGTDQRILFEFEGAQTDPAWSMAVAGE
ncbi:Protein tolB [Desulfamplus magnetovallimortis]|uniref:Protein tolB n=1 Tax=Desulfamplus magnetovallimortis TaxID=1246637 RepID=A0A1W1HKG0_9BACT|nr:Tol-Pal system beta propeller repeat protein TolB [Desulfamplus magnetovallimortis]SLM32943.1 Protein tolB [Desulfamplus magnetovallimortis]